jgi:NADH:ubiquinone oxidoreductase subunit 4 (subunit M)
MGIFTMNANGIQGGLYQMLSHGLVSGALFLCVGVVYDRMHTREIAAYGGLVNRMPKYAVVFLIFTMANVGLLDLDTREKAIIYPLVILVIFYGVYPMPVFEATEVSVNNLIVNYEAALQAAKETAQASLK